MDFYFLTSLVNMFWQIFTILFVLYRFTSFFSMMYNFILFVGKLLKGVVYIKDQISLYIARRRGYSYLSDDEIHDLPSNRNRYTQPSLYTKVTNWIFGRHTRTNIPLYETRTSYVHNFNDHDINRSDINRSELVTPTPLSPRSSHADTEFENHMHNDMMNSREFYKPNSMMHSSLYPPPPPQNFMNSSAVSIYTQTDSESDTQEIYKQDTQESHTKPFNVEDSNLLLNSQFLTKILQPFQSQKLEEEKIDESNYEQEENNKEFEEELLKNPYV